MNLNHVPDKLTRGLHNVPTGRAPSRGRQLARVTHKPRVKPCEGLFWSSVDQSAFLILVSRSFPEAEPVRRGPRVLGGAGAPVMGAEGSSCCPGLSSHHCLLETVKNKKEIARGTLSQGRLMTGSGPLRRQHIRLVFRGLFPISFQPIPGCPSPHGCGGHTP